MTLDDLKKELASADSRRQVELAAEYALDTLGAASASTKKSAKEIVDCVYDKLELELTVGQATFPTYLSPLVQRAESRIASSGRGRGGGYFLVPNEQALVLTQPLTSEPSESEPSLPDGGGAKECQLYPVLQKWLASTQSKAKQTASMRSLGKWSNPDVTGLRVSEHLGKTDIEIITVEAKRDLTNWEREFFEAVSHRRFANRAYFAFPVPESMSQKLPDDMRYYSEIYGVGVLQVVLSDPDFADYKKGADVLSESTAGDVYEVLAAPFHQVPMDQQRRFCEALGIVDLRSLHLWGE